VNLNGVGKGKNETTGVK